MFSETVFETTRLTVRNLVDSDFDAFHEMQSDDEVMRYTTGRGLDEAENRRQLKMCIDCYSRQGNDFWVWAITRKLDGQFVGTCAVVPNERRPEIGYRLLKRFFGMGYGQEICDGLVAYCIQEQRLTEIIAYVDDRNLVSAKIMDRSRLRFIEEITNENGVTDRFYRWSADALPDKTSDNQTVTPNGGSGEEYSINMTSPITVKPPEIAESND